MKDSVKSHVEVNDISEWCQILAVTFQISRWGAYAGFRVCCTLYATHGGSTHIFNRGCSITGTKRSRTCSCQSETSHFSHNALTDGAELGLHIV